MSRFIDAEKIDFSPLKDDFDRARANVIIMGQPTADVVEVKHGYWKDRYGNKYDNHLYECSVCGKEPLYEFYSNELQQIKTRQALSNSCPHCGAKMDGADNAPRQYTKS